MVNRFRTWWRRYFPAQAMSPAVLTVYEQWRLRFFHQRLRLLIWLFVFVLISFVVFEVLLWLVVPDYVEIWDFVIDAVIGVVFAVALGLQTLTWGKQHPGLIFWGMSAGITLTLLVAGILVGNINESDLILWTMVFLAQSTVVPVRWQLHLRSQLTLLLPLTVLVIFVFFSAENAAERSDVVLGTVGTYIYLVWVCIVADLGVYLYERLRYQEFEARQEVQTFLHAVSHDLRNPVTGTQLLLKSLLAQHGEIVPMPRSLLEQMVQSGERQLVLINSLLEAHNNNLKGLALQYQNIHLHQLVDSICNDLAPQLSEANVVIHNQVSTNLPTIPGDSIQLWRVFNNLVINALNHNPPGIAIWVHASVDDSPKRRLRCTVRDNGVGMTAEQCTHLFSLYSQRHRRRHISVGLGLHIARQIVEAHGGAIGVESAVDQGSTFWLTLPLVHPSLSEG